MFLPKFRPTASWFTIVEMILVTLIFSMMSIAAISVYIQTTDISHKLEMTRFLSESAREITERIASDVRERGIDLTALVDPTSTHPGWNTHMYSQSWGEILSVNGSRIYIFGQKNSTWIVPCTEVKKNNPKEICGIYLVEWRNYANALNLADSFIPDESKKRVKIRNATFFVSGNDLTENKVTMIFTLTLTNQSGVKGEYLANSDFTIQTTISERGFRKY